VAESAIGHTRLEVLPGGDLYCSVTLPGVMVATVGGGTALPSQRACLEILGLYGPGKAPALAELAAALCLAGEISIVGPSAPGSSPGPTGRWRARLERRGKEGSDETEPLVGIPTRAFPGLQARVTDSGRLLRRPGVFPCRAVKCPVHRSSPVLRPPLPRCCCFPATADCG